MRSSIWSIPFESVGLAGILLFAASLGAQSTPSRPDAPKELQPPDGQALLLHLKAKGTQIYVCQKTGGSYVWKFKAPDANLFGASGEPAGRHFAGPTWEASDGSRVMGKLVASVPSPDPGSIPWLLLTMKSHDGSGIMTRVQSIQRLDTKGGIAPLVTGCGAANENSETSVPYEANYYFYGTPGP